MLIKRSCRTSSAYIHCIRNLLSALYTKECASNEPFSGLHSENGAGEGRGKERFSGIWGEGGQGLPCVYGTWGSRCWMYVIENPGEYLSKTY